MTKTKLKDVTRVTDAMQFEVGRLRKIVVTIEPKVLTFRLEDTTRKYSLPIGTCYMQAVIAHVEDAKNSKRKKGG